MPMRASLNTASEHDVDAAWPVFAPSMSEDTVFPSLGNLVGLVAWEAALLVRYQKVLGANETYSEDHPPVANRQAIRLGGHRRRQHWTPSVRAAAFGLSN